MRAKNEYKLMSEAYQHVLLENSLESILPSLQFKETTKQAKQYQYTENSQDMPPMSYTVAETQQPVVTITSDGKETQNVAEPNDIIMSGPSREQYVVKPEKFIGERGLYTGKIGGTVTPEQSPRIVARVDNIDQPITFKAPWGEDMILKKGDYLVKDADQGYYRIAQKEYDETYNALGEDNENYDPEPYGTGDGSDASLWRMQMNKQARDRAKAKGKQSENTEATSASFGNKEGYDGPWKNPRRKRPDSGAGAEERDRQNPKRTIRSFRDKQPRTDALVSARKAGAIHKPYVSSFVSDGGKIFAVLGSDGKIIHKTRDEKRAHKWLKDNYDNI